MALPAKDVKIAEMTRYQDDLERAAKVSPAALEQVMNAPPRGLSVHEIDLQKRFLRVGAGHRALLGYNPADMIGRVPQDYVVMRGLSETATTRKLTASAVLLPNIRSFRKADGTEINLLQVERHLKDADGQVIGIRTVIAEAPKEG